MHSISLDAQDESVKRFFTTLPVDPQGSVLELTGHAVTCLVPVPSENGELDAEWTDAKNERRCDLLDKEIDGRLTPAEVVELHHLQQAMLRHRRKVAPLPIAAARKLHGE